MRNQASIALNSDRHKVFYANQLNHIVSMSDMRMIDLEDTYRLRNIKGIEFMTAKARITMDH